MLFLLTAMAYGSLAHFPLGLMLNTNDKIGDGDPNEL